LALFILHPILCNLCIFEGGGWEGEWVMLFCET
jgi:hypothetical protein